MKNKVAILIIFLLTSNTMVAAKTIHSIYLVTKSGLIYEEGSKKPFSGPANSPDKIKGFKNMI